MDDKARPVILINKFSVDPDEAFDLDRAPGSSMTDAERDRYRELFGRVTLVEVTGGINFAALVGVVEDLLSA